jgi:hypothetical protein
MSKEEKNVILGLNEQDVKTETFVRGWLYLGERALQHSIIQRTFLSDDEKKKIFNNCPKINDMI